MIEYNTGNYDKYTTQNPLKRVMVARPNDRILHYVETAVESCQKDIRAGSVRILDAGCGEGFIARMLHTALDDVDITGLELTEDALRIAQKMSAGIRYVQGDITQMPFESGSFDIVLCTEVLEHLENPAAALRELLRVAKNTLIITVPHEPWFRLGNMLVLKNVARFGDPVDHINHWTYHGFASFLKEHSDAVWCLEKSFPWTLSKVCFVR